jgi:biopolymer transport protein ExbD
MKRERKRKKGDTLKLDMTPMIDVVFQLLIFFIVTLKPEDILSHLDVSRPAPDAIKPEEQVQDLLKITIHKDGFVLQGRRVAVTELERQFLQLAKLSTKVSVVVQCTSDSPHNNLIKVLDACAKAGLKNISVFSL